MPHKKLAHTLRKAADAYLARHDVTGERYSTYLAVIKKDWCDLIMIANLIEQNHRHSALKRASHLDTNVREEIPLSVWRWLELGDINEAAKGH